jgi:hypothetical protein
MAKLEVKCLGNSDHMETQPLSLVEQLVVGEIQGHCGRKIEVKWQR